MESGANTDDVIRDFTDLRVWRSAMELASEVYG